MKKLALSFLLAFVLAAGCFAQENNSNTEAKNSGRLILKAGTEISAELQNEIDVAESKRSDDFVMKLTEEIKGETKTIDKGADLIGRISNVKKISSEDDTSEIRLFFDFVKDDDKYLSLKASVTSIKQNGQPMDVQFATSPVFAGATIISKKGKNLQLKEGDVFQIKLDEDLISPDN